MNMFDTIRAEHFDFTYQQAKMKQIVHLHDSWVSDSARQTMIFSYVVAFLIQRLHYLYLKSPNTLSLRLKEEFYTMLKFCELLFLSLPRFQILIHPGFRGLGTRRTVS